MGAIINGYEIVEDLSKGIFCDSFKVRKGGTYYFMKMYKDPTIMSEDYQAFLENQRIMIPLLESLGSQTETIIEDFEVKEAGRYYQVKELIPSSVNLRGWMEAVADYDKRLDAAVQFAQILKAVHGVGIVHQDLKPEQVMVVDATDRKAGVRLVLTDFDWSVPNGKVVRYVSTAGYGNIDGVNLSYKSDIFTLGIILCELLTGCNPYIYTEEGEEERIFEPTVWRSWVMERNYVPPLELNPSLSPAINDLIVRCLDPDQNKRPSLDEILSVLTGGGRKKIRLVARSGEQIILVPGSTYGRSHFKALFRNTTDSEGNPVYMYLDRTYGIVSYMQDGDRLMLSYPAYGKAKNLLRLNGVDLTDAPAEVKVGDVISVFSTARGADVVEFSVQKA